MTNQSSGKLYSTVTGYWPRIAAGLVLAIGLIELVVGGLTANSGLEFYLMAWAGATGGLWFLFEKAERSLSESARDRVLALLERPSLRDRIESIPDQFALLFDRVFGERHLSLACFLRSTVASVGAVAILVAIWIGAAWPKELCELALGSFTPVDYCGTRDVPSVLVAREQLDLSGLFFGSGAVLSLALLFNAIPDYVSLWETRLCLGLSRRPGRLGKILALDLVLTVLISSGLMFGAAWAGFGYSPISDNPQTVLGECALCEGAVRISGVPLAAYQTVSLQPTVGSLTIPIVERRFQPVGGHEPLEQWAWPGGWESDPVRPSPSGLPPGLFFYSAFATSFWLWLYAASVLVSRILLRMNSGVGFLLRVTDVEKQPFRSMGFVSVILVSCLFALGLPLVLL